MPTVEMISVLCDWCRGAPPAVRVVVRPALGGTAVEAAYLEIYDDEIDGLRPVEGFAPERRAHITRTLDQLELLATDYWRDDPPTPA